MDCLWVCQYLNTFYILHQTHKFIANPYWETWFSFHSSKPDSMLHINVFIQIEMGKIAVDHTKITREINYKKLYFSTLQIHNLNIIKLLWAIVWFCYMEQVWKSKLCQMSIVYDFLSSVFTFQDFRFWHKLMLANLISI